MHSQAAARKTGLPGAWAELLEKFGDRMRTIRCEATAPIVVRGEILNDVYFVARGRVEARYKVPRLGPQVLILSAGDFFGERAVLEDAASDAAVRPLEPGVVLAAVPVEAFQAALVAEPRLREAFLESVAARRTLLRAMVLSKGPEPY